jgi:predicted amidophosphoribosyltransferase
MTTDPHTEHWMEPSAVTVERSKDEKFCETCGEEIPWHNASCAMLKNAHKRRFGKCTFCAEEHRVGELMRQHVMDKHKKELKALIS